MYFVFAASQRVDYRNYCHANHNCACSTHHIEYITGGPSAEWLHSRGAGREQMHGRTVLIHWHTQH